ncbi:MAG: helix-turn-helix domain-containing protein [Actinomycetota bacterium]|nr:helix-turn-helix domain-containing protein [Actinomycetota bacterium]
MNRSVEPHGAYLSAKLRSLRKEADLTGKALAQRAGMSQSKISKIETGRLAPSPGDVTRLAAALDASRETRDQLLAHAEALHTQFNSLARAPSPGSDWTTWFREAERSSTTLRIFQTAIVPALLQTRPYAEEVLKRAEFLASGDVAETAARLERQSILCKTSKEFVVVMTESALRTKIGSAEMMRAQLDRVVELSSLPNVRVGVILWATEVPVIPYNSFCIFDERLVLSETMTAEVMVRESRDIASYLKTFSVLQREATFDDAAREIVSDIARSFQAYRPEGGPPGSLKGGSSPSAIEETSGAAGPP